MKTSGNGAIALFNDGNSGIIKVDPSTGALKYISSKSGLITGTAVVNDNKWHKIIFTHFYARGETDLYVDGVLQGKTIEQLEVKSVYLNPENAPQSLAYSNWFFYRSGMNQDEISALQEGKMLKSSLELYAALDGSEADSLKNTAQSTNSIRVKTITTDIREESGGLPLFEMSPNPCTGQVKIAYIITNKTSVCLNVTDISGRIIKKIVKENQDPGHYEVKLEVDGSNMQPGVYLVQIKLGNQSNVKRLMVTR